MYLRCFSYINLRFLKLPPTIGVMLLSLVLSLLVLAAGNSFPWFSNFIVTLIGGIDFGKLLMKVMLGFLLFAGAIHIDATALRKQMLSIIALSTIGTLLSTALIAVAIFYMLRCSTCKYHLFTACCLQRSYPLPIRWRFWLY